MIIYVLFIPRMHNNFNNFSEQKSKPGPDGKETGNSAPIAILIQQWAAHLWPTSESEIFQISLINAILDQSIYLYDQKSRSAIVTIKKY